MNLKEHIRKVLREETLKETLLSEMKRSGVRDTANLMSLEPKELLEMVGLKGTQEDMIILAKIIMDNDVKKALKELKYCNYRIVPTLHSIEILVYIPKPLPEHEGHYMYDQLVRNTAYEIVSKTIYKLSGGIIRGHNIYIYNTGNC